MKSSAREKAGKHSMKMMSVMSDLVNLSLIKIAIVNYQVTMSDFSLRKGWAGGMQVVSEVAKEIRHCQSSQ